MKRTLILIVAVCALLASAIFAFGDIPRPKPTPAATPKAALYSSLIITSDAKISEARLIISEATLKTLQEDMARRGKGSLGQQIIHSSTRTIMAGLFMFLAVSFAGVWFARSEKRRNHKAIAAVFLVAMVFGLTTVIVRANAGPPGYVRWQNLPEALKAGKETEGGVEIEVVAGDDDMKLIIPLRKK